MKKLTLLLLIVVAFAGLVQAQNPPQASTGVIEGADVTGVAEDSLSEALRGSIRALVGQRYDAAAADQIATRIQSEVQDTVAAHRTQPGSAPDRVRLVFVVARASAATVAAESNVNAQYTVESVEVRGVDRSAYSDILYEDLQKMVGKRLDSKLAEDLRLRLVGETKGRYFVSQKTERGTQPEHVKVVFETERTPWLFRLTIGKFINVSASGDSKSDGDGTPDEKKTVRYVDLNGIPRSFISDALFTEMQAMVGKQTDSIEANHVLEKLKTELKEDYSVAMSISDGTTPQESRITYAVNRVPWLPYRNPKGKLAYHSKQGFTLLCCSDDFIGDHTTLTAGWDGDSLIERYKGIGIGIESRSLGTRRFGARLAFESFGPQWKQQTRRDVAASGLGLDSGFELYRTRLSVAPSVAFALNRHMYITGGANFTQLRIEGPVERWQSVNEGVASLRYDTREVKHGDTTFESKGGYEIRSGARSIGTDLVFTRHAVDADTSAGYGKNKIRLALGGGKISGHAPMFERFSLGNTTTLRGWNKYDLAPLGGSRMWNATLEYRYGAVGFFLDHGSVWDPGMSHPIRRSVGITLWRSIGLAFPLQCSRQCGAMFYVHLQ